MVRGEHLDVVAGVDVADAALRSVELHGETDVALAHADGVQLLLRGGESGGRDLLVRQDRRRGGGSLKLGEGGDGSADERVLRDVDLREETLLDQGVQALIGGDLLGRHDHRGELTTLFRLFLHPLRVQDHGRSRAHREHDRYRYHQTS